jgi:SAM-dependent methyltransferase
VTVSDAWETHSSDWITWARAAGHDGFWDGTWPALRRLLPPTDAHPVLDLGCGEGRAGRLLLESGRRVVGVDRSRTLAGAAHDADPPLPVVVADASALPFPTGTFGLVLACMSLHDIDDFRGAISEAGRVLRVGGSFCAAVVHPFCSAQDDETLHRDGFSVTRPYLHARPYEDRVERDGMRMTFVSVHRPLRDYVGAMAEAGLALTALDEAGDTTVPWLLTLRAERR